MFECVLNTTLYIGIYLLQERFIVSVLPLDEMSFYFFYLGKVRGSHKKSNKRLWQKEYIYFWFWSVNFSNILWSCRVVLENMREQVSTITKQKASRIISIFSNRLNTKISVCHCVLSQDKKGYNLSSNCLTLSL